MFQREIVELLLVVLVDVVLVVSHCEIWSDFIVAFVLAVVEEEESLVVIDLHESQQ